MIEQYYRVLLRIDLIRNRHTSHTNAVRHGLELLDGTILYSFGTSRATISIFARHRRVDLLGLYRIWWVLYQLLSTKPGWRKQPYCHPSRSTGIASFTNRYKCCHGYIDLLGSNQRKVYIYRAFCLLNQELCRNNHDVSLGFVKNCTIYPEWVE
jgi:hypothetical protein